MTRNHHGFTIIEIVVVLVLISVIAAAVFTRSITTDQINFVGQVDKILSHIRYARSLAMKHGQADNSERWGIVSLGSVYWLFHWSTDPPPIPPGAWQALAIKFPGEESDKISLSDLGLWMSGYSLYFDKYGKPSIGSATAYFPNDLEITISNDQYSPTQEQTIVITPETGLVRKIDE